MGVVVRRYIDILTIIINYPNSTCISSFLAAASIHLCSFLCSYVILVQYIENVKQRTFEIVKKSRSREYNYLLISIIKNIERESRDFHVRGTE